MMNMRNTMDRLLEETFSRPGVADHRGRAIGFPADLIERGDQLVLRAALPGVDPGNLDVTLHGQSLVIRGERPAYQEQTGDRWLLREQEAGWFERSFHLPAAVDAKHAEAEFAHGILTLTMPKLEVAKRHRIRIGKPAQSAQDAQARTPAKVNPTLVDPTKPERGPREAAPQHRDPQTTLAEDTPNDDLVSAESESSFPASDPPSWTPERA